MARITKLSYLSSTDAEDDLNNNSPLPQIHSIATKQVMKLLKSEKQPAVNLFTLILENAVKNDGSQVIQKVLREEDIHQQLLSPLESVGNDERSNESCCRSDAAFKSLEDKAEVAALKAINEKAMDSNKA